MNETQSRYFTRNSALGHPAISGSILFLVAVGLIAFGWVGPTDSDDLVYAEAAQRWVNHFPYVADGHHGLRHTIVLPMALLFSIFGPNEATLAAPLLLYLAALLMLLFLCVRHVADSLTALLAVALIVLVPIISSGISVVTTDLPEAFFDIASVWAFYFAVQRPRWWLFLLSGVLTGLGFITRETSIIMLLLYGIAFLFGYGGIRKNYLWIGAGFAAVIGLDTLFLFWGTGDPLWRIHMSEKGVANDSPATFAQTSTVPGLDRFGAIAAPRLLQLPIILFVDHNFGLFFWLVMPAALAAFRSAGQKGVVARLFGGLALLWALVTGYVLLSLWVLPRYEIVTAVALAIPAAISIVWLIRHGWQRAVWAAFAILLVSNVALVGATDREPLFGEQALVAFARNSDTVVLTDPNTFSHAAWLLETNRLSDRVEVGLPRPGAVYFYNSTPRQTRQVEWPVKQAQPGWKLIEKVEETPRWPARIIGLFRIRDRLPPALLSKLDPPRRWAAAFKVPEGG
jgi:4-amino-4-deoxy-L-arabinose transferase-like glycosyltransferase